MPPCKQKQKLKQIQKRQTLNLIQRVLQNRFVIYEIIYSLVHSYVVIFNSEII